MTPIFICGMPRSGTSLLKGLLDGHSQLLVAPGETFFWRKFAGRTRGMAPEARRATARRILLGALDPQAGYYRMYFQHIDPDRAWAEFQRYLQSTPGRDADYLTAALQAYGAASGHLSAATRYWVEKTPGNELFAASIFATWPAARCLHLIRDPRAVVHTYQQRQTKRFRLVRVLQQWQTSVALAQRHAAEHAPRYRVLRYEDLVREPEVMLAEVRRWLEIDADPCLMRPTKANGKHAWRGNSAFGRLQDGIDRNAAERWRAHLQPQTVARVDAYLARSMAQFGYPRAADPNVAVRLWARLARAGVRLTGGR